MNKKAAGGKKKKEESFSGLEHLFGSKTRFNLLKIFCRESEKKFFVRELARNLGSQLNAVRREVLNLENLGFIVEISDNDAKKRFYQLNTNFVLKSEINALIKKSDLLAEKQLVEHLEATGNIELCIFSGVLVGEKGICDILIVGKADKEKLGKVIKRFEEEVNAELSYAVFSIEEYKHRKSLTDRFLFNIFEGNKRVVIDKNEEFKI